jgi:hypothetical protein
MLVTSLLAVLIYLIAVYYLTDVLYDGCQVLLHRLAPKPKLIWAILPAGAPRGLRAGLSRAALDLDITLKVYQGATDFTSRLDSVFLPELVVWYGATRSDVPVIQELQRNAVQVVAVDPSQPIVGTLSLRQDATSDDSAYWASFRQGYWAAASVGVSLHDFIFFPADITEQ